MRKVELFLLPRLWRHKITGSRLLICFIFLFEFSLKVTSSLSPTISSSSHNIISTTYSFVLSSSITAPIPSPTPQNTCWSGLDTEDFRNVIIGTNNMYLDISKPINCSGAITSWQYCHYVIGFRNASSGLWPCVWRRSIVNDSEAIYNSVGCNRFIVVPGDGDNFRCRYFIPSNPSDVIQVAEGDYIGFYVPDSGLLPALSIVDDNAGDDQLLRVRNVTGFTTYLKDSELRLVTPPSGSALLRAEIDSNWTYPSIVLSASSMTPTASPEPTQPVTMSKTTTRTTVATTVVLPLAVSLVIAVGVTVLLIITVIALIAYVSCKPKYLSNNDKNLANVNNDMEYNDIYGFQNTHYVVAVNKQPTVKLRDNPAYDSRYHLPLPHARLPPVPMENDASSSERRQLEHTYEYVSDL